MVKKDKKRRKRRKDKTEEQTVESDVEEDWWCCVREEVAAGVRFPTIDQPVAEAVCILADLDTWHVGILSNNTPLESPPLPVGMSRLVANMLEAFAYVWRKYHSPLHVRTINIRINELIVNVNYKIYLIYVKFIGYSQRIKNKVMQFLTRSR